jgi:cytochrome c
MRTRFVATGLFVAVLALAGTSATAATPKDDAMALVKKAVAYAKANGPEKTIAAINDPAGGFRKGDIYVFVQTKAGTVVAHMNPRMVGKDLSDMKDPDGKAFPMEFAATAAKGGGWVDYKFANPTTKQVEAKTTYVELAGDLIIGCGVYK